MTIKVFEMNEYDWYAAETLEEAIEAYKETMGAEDADEYLDNPHALTDDEMNTLIITNSDDIDDTVEMLKGEKITFRKHLDNLIAAGEKFPVFFASTEV